MRSPQQLACNALTLVSLITLPVAISLKPATAGECVFTDVVGVNLGSYDVFSPVPTDSAGSITYRCSNLSSTPIVIELSAGNSSTYQTRQMVQGNERLNYNLYLDAARTIVWGNSTEGSSAYGPVLPADNVDTTVYIYGRIPARQNARGGGYSDTVTITINY